MRTVYEIFHVDINKKERDFIAKMHKTIEHIMVTLVSPVEEKPFLARVCMCFEKRFKKFLFIVACFLCFFYFLSNFNYFFNL